MKISILGSCVTRDAFSPANAEDFELVRYVARSSLGSIFAPPVSDEVPLDRIASAFQRKVVGWDVTKAAAADMFDEDFDVLVYDPIDERFELALFPDGGVATVSSEFNSMKWELPEGVTKVKGMGDEHFTRWSAGWKQLLDELDARGKRDRLLVHVARWATNVKDSPGETPVYALPVLQAANAGIDRMMDVVGQDLPASQLLHVQPDLLMATREHQWGLSPFHYVPEYQQELCRLLLAGRAART